MNQILVDRRQQLYWSEQDKLKLFKITANYMNYNWHSSDKKHLNTGHEGQDELDNKWIAVSTQQEETIDYWSNEGQDYKDKIETDFHRHRQKEW